MYNIETSGSHVTSGPEFQQIITWDVEDSTQKKQPSELSDVMCSFLFQQSKAGKYFLPGQQMCCSALRKYPEAPGTARLPPVVAWDLVGLFAELISWDALGICSHD